MMNSLKSSLNKRDLLKRIGHLSQICNIKEYTLTSGLAKGVRCIDLESGAGLQFTVVLDRAMDIAWCRYKGIPISYISKCGIVSLAYYNGEGSEFFRSFFGGLLTTCGLRNTGPACEVDGERYGLHGRISNIPAENVSIFTDWQDDELIITVRGLMREARFMGENLTLTRELKVKLGDNKFFIFDTIENEGYREEPLLLLYHYNFGYPLLSHFSKLYLSTNKVTARDAEAENGLDYYHSFKEPTQGFNEQVFFHDVNADVDGFCKVGIFNENLGENGVGCYIKYNKKKFPILTQWNQFGENEYVLGLEPCNCLPLGRKESIKRNDIPLLQQGEKITYKFEVGIVESVEEMTV